jgi:hypothetical protein
VKTLLAIIAVFALVGIAIDMTRIARALECSNGVTEMCRP